MRVVSTFLFLGFCINTFSQTSHYIQRPAIGLHTAFLDFKGADSMRKFGNTLQTGLSLSYQDGFSEQLGYTITITGTFLDLPNRHNTSLGNGKDELLLEADISIQGRLLPVSNWLSPYVLAGAGISKYKNYYGMFIPAGAGVQVNFSADIFVLINSQYRIPVTTFQHKHFYHSIGLAGAIGKKKITKTKLQPVMPVAVITVADTDSDGIADSLDNCPQVAGLARYKGCPVPDSDQDGINDEMDKCPDTPGLTGYNGCPVPDRDYDGLNDEEDQCPGVPGPVANRGCPEITGAIKARMEAAAKNIFFETGSYTLIPASCKALDDVVLLLQQNQHFLLNIEGYTDNTGTLENNRLLSESRANEVLNYLAQKGIVKKRVTARGYGETRPVADNNSPQGRAKNRRVELILKLK